MNEQFVTYELALKLKKLGFDEECFGIFSNNEQLIVSNNDISYVQWFKEKELGISAPLWQQVIDWFREKHEIHISIDSYNLDEDDNIMDYQYSYQMITTKEYNKIPCEYFNSYGQCREQAILKAIELLKNK